MATPPKSPRPPALPMHTLTHAHAPRDKRECGEEASAKKNLKEREIEKQRFYCGLMGNHQEGQASCRARGPVSDAVLSTSSQSDVAARGQFAVSQAQQDVVHRCVLVLKTRVRTRSPFRLPSTWEIKGSFHCLRVVVVVGGGAGGKCDAQCTAVCLFAPVTKRKKHEASC